MKGERVAQLELLLRSHPEGMRRAEIARRLGVHRSTISRYVEDLSEKIDIYEENNLKLTTLLVVGEAIGHREGLSRLYADEFKHLYRK